MLYSELKLRYTKRNLFQFAKNQVANPFYPTQQWKPTEFIPSAGRLAARPDLSCNIAELQDVQDSIGILLLNTCLFISYLQLTITQTAWKITNLT